MEAEVRTTWKEFFMKVYVNSSRSDSCRHDKTSPVVTRTLYVVLCSDNEACMWLVSHSGKKGNHTTLEHCLWFWHQTKDPLFCKREGKISSVIRKNTFSYQFIKWICGFELLLFNQYILIQLSPKSRPFGVTIMWTLDTFQRVSFACWVHVT